MTSSDENNCTHAALQKTPSPYATDVGYHPRSCQQLFTASTGSRKRIKPSEIEYLSLYPAPLVLPDDDLACDPDYPPQSFTSWKNEKDRNAVTTERTTVYVADYPQIGAQMGRQLTRWMKPNDGRVISRPIPPSPPIDQVLTYLQAFFHGIPVKKLVDPLIFTAWSKDSRLMMKPPHVGLKSSRSNVETCIRVRSRSSYSTQDHDSSLPVPYCAQLNLNDILDHATYILPSDAYALLLLVNHDLYEDDEDDFCVGRAYGGSRIAVVSAARYRPDLDQKAGINRAEGHWWPGSHCEDFVRETCEAMTEQRQEGKMKSVTIQAEDHRAESPLQRAMDVHNFAIRDYISHRNTPDRYTYYSNEFLNLHTRRLCLTASHELLHCFGLDHCVYFACAMQGTSCLAEDSRQPPYLCPVCENKLAAVVALKLTREEKMGDQWWNQTVVRKWREDRMKALIAVCRGQDQASLGFAALGAWYEGVMQVME